MSEGGKKKITLPSSGLAEEILAQLRAQQQQEEAGERTEGPREEETSQTWLTFLLEERSYAVPAARLREVVQLGHMTRVPHAPPSIRGMTTVRGQPISVLDLRQRLGLRERDLTAESRLLVVRAPGRSVGFLVDRVDQVVQMKPSQIAPPPAAEAARQPALLGVYTQPPRPSALLDVPQLLKLERETQDSPRVDG